MKNNKEEIKDLVKIENFINFNKKLEITDVTFEKLMFIYSIAIKELKTKIEIIKEEYATLYKYDLIDHIKTRIKSPESITQKMKEKKCNFTYKNMIDKINDIAGIRVVCPLKKDIITAKNLFEKIPGVNIIKEKDYINNPKNSGYSGYHMILEVPVNLCSQTIYVKVEVQIRTMAMDFWATLEHRTNYKPKTGKESKKNKIQKEWRRYAKLIDKLDNKIILNNDF